MVAIKSGDIVVGFDFGRLKNHIVAARIRVNESHADQYELISWDIYNFETPTLRKKLQSLVEIQMEGDWFILETQTRTNTQCFVLAHALETMLLCRNVPPSHIFSSSSKGKFKILDAEEKFKPAAKKMSHAIMKKWAVNLTTHYLKTQQGCELFYSMKKKDDLADAFLYAVAFVKKNSNMRDTPVTNLTVQMK